MSEFTEFHLLQYLLSPHALFGLASYKATKNIEFEESNKKVLNRLAYLKTIRYTQPDSFAALCHRHGVVDDTTRNPQETPEQVDSPSAAFVTPVDSIRQVRRNIVYDMAETMNQLGKRIVLKLPGGLYFCICWVESILDPDILQIVVAEDGMSVLEKNKVPEPKTAKDLVSMYDWSSQKNNLVVKHLDGELRRLKAELKEESKWVTKVLIETDEEIIRKFVDIDGNPTNHIESKTDEDGISRPIAGAEGSISTLLSYG